MEANPNPRRIVDPAVLKGLAHPLRRRVLEVLVVDGPATVSMLAATLDEQVGKVSFHVAQLAKHELIEPVPELARDRRERWWRTSGFSWSDGDFLDDPADKAAADAAFAVNVTEHMNRVREFRRTMADWGKQWANAAYCADHWLTLTPAELSEVASEIEAVLDRWQRREIPEDDEHRDRVYTFVYAFPRQL